MGIAAGAAAIVGAVGLEGVAATAATIGLEAVAGAGLGALTSEITGGDPGMGALFGGLGGGIAGGVGEAFGPATSGAASAASEAGGAAAGAAPIAGVAASAPVDLASAADAITGTGASAAGTAGAGLAGAGATGALDAATLSGGATGLTTDTASALQTLGGAGAGGGGVAATPAADLSALTADQQAATISGGATGASAAPLSSANIAGGAGAPQSFLDKIVSGAGSSIGKNPVGTALAGAGLIKDIAGQKQDPNEKALANQAAALNAQIGQLEAPLTSGQLPPGAQAAVNQGVASAKAAIRSRYASLGLSGSTMEAQDLANVDMRQQTQVFQLASNLFSQGIQGAQLSEQIYKDLLGANQAQNQQTGQAIANLAGALSGGGQNVTLKVA